MSLRLVVENDEIDDNGRDQRWAEDGLGGPLRTLAANLMRIVRGAGHPERLMDQIAALREAFDHYRAAFGHWPPPDVIHNALIIDHEPTSRESLGDEERDELRRLSDWREQSASEVQRASLQIIASMLLDQKPQLRSGEHDFWSSFYQTRDAHDAYLAGWNKSIVPKTRKPAKKPRGNGRPSKTK
ncbi:MAG: hypothetical protein ABIQ30_10095 [Devosia sp.]